MSGSLTFALCLQLKQTLDEKAAEVAEVATELAEKVIACHHGSAHLCWKSLRASCLPQSLIHTLGMLQQEARTALLEAAATVKEELRKLATEQRAAQKSLRAASHKAAQAAASLADKRAELTAVKESDQELQEQQFQETQVLCMLLRTGPAWVAARCSCG